MVYGKNPFVIGRKGKFKVYKSHSGYPGGLKEIFRKDKLKTYHWADVTK